MELQELVEQIEKVRSALRSLKEQEISFDHACYLLVNTQRITYGAAKDTLKMYQELTGISLEKTQ
jgi:hypothetical protein